jgi:Tfp pilus assembly protein PilN
MALHINLLHERLAARTQRERDPLKLGFLVVLAVAGVLAALHVTASQRLSSASRDADSLRAELAKLKPLAADAAVRERELRSVLSGGDALARRSERRMFWGPLLEVIAAIVPREVQINVLNGGVSGAGDTVDVSLDGLAAGSEPRKVAEDFRLALRARVAAVYPGADAKFRVLEDEPGTVALDGQQWSMAHFVIRISFPHPKSRPDPAP